MNESRDLHEIFQNNNINSDDLCQALVSSMGDALVAVSNEGQILLVNAIGEILTGWTRHEILGKNISEIYQVKDIDKGTLLSEIPILRVFDEKEAFSVHHRFLLTRKDGTEIPISETATPIADGDGNLVGAILVFREISETLDAESRIEHLATHDYLTGLPNRRLFVDRLDRALSQSRREFRRVGVVFIDLNEFKQINDNYGREFGDAVLKRVAKELTNTVRESDSVARIGGDEFAILLTNLSDRKDIIPVKSKVTDAFKNRLTIKGRLVQINISVGEALYPDDAEDIDSLLDRADRLMYAHKQSNKNSQ